MSYQIIYDSPKEYIESTGRKNARTGLTVGILAILALCVLRISGLGTALWQALIPGDPAVTAAAFQNMTSGLQNGQSISDAIFVFCETVIQGAQLG